MLLHTWIISSCTHTLAYIHIHTCTHTHTQYIRTLAHNVFTCMNGSETTHDQLYSLAHPPVYHIPLHGKLRDLVFIIYSHVKPGVAYLIYRYSIIGSDGSLQ